MWHAVDEDNMKTAFMLSSLVPLYVDFVALLMWKRQADPATADQKASQIAHVLRRCGFGPRPGEVARWLDRGPEALIESLLANDEIHALDESDLFAPFENPDDIDDGEVFAIFLDQMMNGENQLHERMAWYWQTHFTSSVESGGRRYGWQQHHLIRRLALGNFRELARAISTNPAMLYYLDGNGSRGDNPNENYCLLYTSPSPRDATLSRMPSSA